MISIFLYTMINLTNQQLSSSIQSYFSELQSEKNEDRFDVTLVSEERTILKAHKFVLAVGSRFFREIFKLSPHNSSPLLYIRGASEDMLSNILLFLYNGEVNIEEEQLAQFVKISNELQIIGICPPEMPEITEKKEVDDSDVSDCETVVYSEISREIPRTYENMMDKSAICGALEDKLDVKMSVRSKSYVSMDHIYTDIDRQTDRSEVTEEVKEEEQENKVNLAAAGRVECKLCGKTFKNKNSLKVHKYRYHTGEKILQESLIIMT